MKHFLLIVVDDTDTELYSTHKQAEFQLKAELACRRRFTAVIQY